MQKSNLRIYDITNNQEISLRPHDFYRICDLNVNKIEIEASPP